MWGWAPASLSTSPRLIPISPERKRDWEHSAEYTNVKQLFEKEFSEHATGSGLLKVWRVENWVVWDRYKAARDLRGGTDEYPLWHSTSDADPASPCLDTNGLDPTRSKGGAFGRGIYLAQHALYSHLCLTPPCESSTELGIKGGYFLIIARAVLGRCKDFKDTVNDMTKTLMREPVGYESWCGTEGDLKCTGVKDVLDGHEKSDPPYNRCAGLLKKNGNVYGKQYIFAREERMYPQYIIHYHFGPR